jgi:hypothetical protein
MDAQALKQVGIIIGFVILGAAFIAVSGGF